MALAAMVAADEDALVCDFAEYYSIYNWRGLPLRYAAVLACGLREGSRIRLHMTQQKVAADTVLQAAAVDALNLLVWLQTKDAQRRRNKPMSIVEILTGNKEEDDKPQAFMSPEAFEEARRRILNGD